VNRLLRGTAARVAPAPAAAGHGHTQERALAGPDASPAPRHGGAPSGGAEPAYRHRAGPLTFTRLKWASVTHSCVYAGLLCAAILGWATPTLILGWTHGILWIVMSLTCIVAVRLRLIPLRTGVAVAVLGGIGPFFGSYEFIREQRRRASPEEHAQTTGQ
jgi:hypothetical protein